jgi:hypothetical protein
MGIEGSLAIRLSTAGGAVRSVAIRSSRPVMVADVFCGKRIEECREMLPLLFSVCATAQTCAGVRACEGALGLPMLPAVEQIRERLVRMETVREHLWRILLDWPAFVGGAADRESMAEAVALHREYRLALCPDQDPFQVGILRCSTGDSLLGGILDRLDGLLQRAVFGMPKSRWLELTQEDALTAWAGKRATTAAALIDDLVKQGLRGIGGCLVDPLPMLEPLRLERAMRDIAYLQQPQWSGSCRETSCLTRTRSALLERLQRVYGNGLLVRLVSRLSELAQLAGSLLPSRAETSMESGAGSVAPPVGVGQVAAARGQLAHRVELEGERIASYRILAPTEWNFHPRGVVARALSSLKAGPRQLEQQARLLINAVDPCVGYELAIG